MASMQKINVKGTNYYSIVESRRINGKPWPVTIEYLGNIENILKVFNNPKSIRESATFKSYSHGAVYALWSIAKKHNILKFLDDIFPEQKRNGLSRGESILCASIYRAIYSGSKNEFSEWAEETTLPSIMKFQSEKITSSHFWDQMDGISEDMLQSAEDRISSHVLKYYKIRPEKLALDYTNYFTYISSSNKKSKLAKRGKNKQKRNDLKQVSLGLITTKELAIPLCSHVYDGIINDVTEFSEYLKILKKRISNYTDASEITLVYDNGSVSKKNLDALRSDDIKINYICGFSLTSCKALLDIPFEDYEKIMIYADREVLCYRTIRKIWDKHRTCLLTFSQDLYDGQYEELMKSILKKKEQLNELNEQLKNPKSKISKDASEISKRIKGILSGNHLKEIFKITTIGDSIVKDIEFEVDVSAIEAVCKKHFGKKLLITDHDDWKTNEILEAYRDQIDIESIFKDTKNKHHFSIQPMFHWTDDKIRIHTFCCLLGLLLTSLLKKELFDEGIKLENRKIIDILSGIREVYILKADKKAKNDFSVEKTLEEMTKIQADIWSMLERKVFKAKKVNYTFSKSL